VLRVLSHEQQHFSRKHWERFVERVFVVFFFVLSQRQGSKKQKKKKKKLIETFLLITRSEINVATCVCSILAREDRLPTRRFTWMERSRLSYSILKAALFSPGTTRYDFRCFISIFFLSCAPEKKMKAEMLILFVAFHRAPFMSFSSLLRAVGRNFSERPPWQLPGEQ
jgi:hypothetical protein